MQGDLSTPVQCGHQGVFEDPLICVNKTIWITIIFAGGNIGVISLSLSKHYETCTFSQVTEFVARDEAATGIMKVSSPRKLWPLESDCPACRDKSSDDTDWDETAVYHFLMWWYGPLLRVTDKETTQISRLFVGVGQGDKSSSVSYLTASGVAFSGMGLATYHWRVHCKKLKYRLA